MAASHSFYVVFGLLGVLLNLAVAVALGTDKQMRNSTYKFMTHLALADACLVFGLLLGPHITLTAGYPLPPSGVLGRIFAYCNGFGYHAAVLFMVLVSFSRWVHFAQKQHTDSLFGGRRHKVVCASVWLFVLAFVSPFLYYPNAFDFVPDTGLYIYSNSTYSRTMQMFDEIVNVLAVFFQILFNTMSIVWIMQMRQQVLSPELQVRNKQEMKLFALCMIDSSVYCLLIAVHYYSMYVDNGETVGLVLEVLFLLNHVDCAFLYLCFNRKLRMDIFTFVKGRVVMVSTVTVSPVSKFGGGIHSTTGSIVTRGRSKL